MGNEHRRRRIPGEGDAWELCHGGPPKPGKRHDAKTATARRERREEQREVDNRCTDDATPWFRPEEGDRYATDDEWDAMTADMPCTCEQAGQAMCFRHTGSRFILGGLS